MKLIRFGHPGMEKPGIMTQDGRRLDLSSYVRDYDEQFFEEDGLAAVQELLASSREKLPEILPEERLGPPTARPSKLICIGLNYAEHARESGMDAPKEPVIFFKATTAICGPNDDLVLPRGSKKTDWEVELAVVIGKRAKYVAREAAMDHVAGYTLHNDYSERTYQLERGGQWVKGKSCDTFAPIGPFLATKDEIRDPNKLDLWLKLNGETVQGSNTTDFIFDIPFVVSYLSEFMTLLPGDIISTGTPSGVGLGMKPPRYLKAGDVVELGIEGLGSSRQVVREEKSE